jgi:hypothetical protein
MFRNLDDNVVYMGAVKDFFHGEKAENLVTKLSFKQFKVIFMDPSRVVGLCIETQIYRFLIL